MKRKYLIWLAIAAVIGVALFVRGFLYLQTENRLPLASPFPTIKPNVVVFSPTAGEIVSSPITIRGEARVFENTVSIRIRDASGKEVLQDFTNANAPDAGFFGPFEKTIFIPALSDSRFTLEVFWQSPKDGSDLDVVSIPLFLDEVTTTNVKVFFNSSQLDPEATCTKVFPVTRAFARTSQIGRAALLELLKGPTVPEKTKDYFTSIPPYVELRSLRIENGTAYADFNDALEWQVGGSCRVAAIRAQISETLKQFPSVKNVVISINGRTEDILQP